LPLFPKNPENPDRVAFSDKIDIIIFIELPLQGFSYSAFCFLSFGAQD
jgi:hypothetical protein